MIPFVPFYVPFVPFCVTFVPFYMYVPFVPFCVPCVPFVPFYMYVPFVPFKVPFVPFCVPFVPFYVPFLPFCAPFVIDWNLWCTFLLLWESKKTFSWHVIFLQMKRDVYIIYMYIFMGAWYLVYALHFWREHCCLVIFLMYVCNVCMISCI